MKQLLSKINFGYLDSCWLWFGATNKAGYGNIKYKGKSINAHRLSYLYYNGEIPEGLFVCHSCDNPPCVNPYHLFLGTPQDNDTDKVLKDRQVKGTAHKLSKLNDDKVKNIRIDCRSNEEIAKDYKVSRRLIGMVKKKQIWKHI